MDPELSILYMGYIAFETLFSFCLIICDDTVVNEWCTRRLRRSRATINAASLNWDEKIDARHLMLGKARSLVEKESESSDKRSFKITCIPNADG